MAIQLPPPPQCRFCLENEATQENPLIEPCRCRGSVRFVHWGCLRRWIALDPAHNGTECSICHTPFHAWAVPQIESIPKLSYLEDLILNYSGYIGIALQYLLIVDSWSRALSFRAYDPLVSCGHVIITTHILYALVFWKVWSVRNWSHYKVFLQKGVMPILLGCHAMFLVSFLAYRDPVQPLLAYVILNRYYTEHVKLLRSVNRVVLQI